VWKAQECEQPLQLINAAEEINSSMPGRVVERICRELGRRGQSLQEAPILLLGMSYKRGIGDLRESPALRIFELLEAGGAEVAYHDPYIPAFNLQGRVLQSQPLSRELLAKQACVVLLTDHEYDLKLVLSASRLVLDTRNAIKSPAPNCVSMWRKNGHHAPAPHWQDDRDLSPVLY
jgi:UDP-N-acetyl-D-glucosamine dehydrogenase